MRPGQAWLSAYIAIISLLYVQHHMHAYERTAEQPFKYVSVTGKCRKVPSLIIFAQYGVLGRSRGCVRDVNYVNVMQAATGNFSIPYVNIGVGIDMEGSPVDDVNIPKSESEALIKAANFSQLENVNFSEIDRRVEYKYCKPRSELCREPFWGDWYEEYHIVRALRAMYCEFRLSALLGKYHDVDDVVVIVQSSDILLNRPLHYTDILAAACNKNTVYLTRNNDGGNDDAGHGYTDGFYLGHISAISAILTTYDLLPTHFTSGLRAQDYEYLLRATFQSTGIERRILSGFGSPLRDFIKVRASGDTFGELQCEARQLLDFSKCPQLAEMSCFISY